MKIHSEKIDYNSIQPISARAIIVVEEGQVEVIISGYKFSFTIHEYSDKNVVVLLDDNKPKARKLLESFGVSFKKDTKDKIYGDEFVSYIHEIYGYSNTRGGGSCDWQIEGIGELDYKEF